MQTSLIQIDPTSILISPAGINTPRSKTTQSLEPSKILIVDDQPIGRESIESVLLSPEYALFFASNGLEALQIAVDVTPELILLDVMMPGMSGFEVCQHLRADPKLAEVPILLLTALDDAESRLEGLEAGADDFITKPFNRVELRARVKTITRLARYRKLINERTSLEMAHAQLMTAYDATIEGWSRALELRDQETEGHTQRVANLSVLMGRALGLSDEDLKQLKRGALLHDMGKLGIPDSILLKPGTLTEQEWETMRRHPQLAFDMLYPIEYLRPALDIPYCHHEKWDGTGYPRGLKGEEIPRAARIFAIVDVWDALISQRPYRPAWSKTRALEHIQANAGIHFDPQIIAVFLEVVIKGS